MTPAPFHQLSVRERQIMDVLHRLGKATVAEVVERLEEEVSYNSVRVTLSILESKGQVKHRRLGKRYLYAPTVTTERARKSALRHLVSTFFQGSEGDLASTLLGMSAKKLSDEDLDRLRELIEREKQERGHE